MLFGIGYAIGGRDSPDKPVQTIAMTGSAGATASIALLAPDEAGNWPMRLEVSGLPALPAGQSYTLWLTKDGALAESCGSFVVGGRHDEGPAQRPVQAEAVRLLGDRADGHDEPVAAQRHDLRPGAAVLRPARYRRRS